MKLNATQLAVCTGARIDRAERRVAGINYAMECYSVQTPRRVAMFLANIGHETMGLKYLAEIWGPTAQQLRYERDFAKPWPVDAQQARQPAFAANRLAWSLGNVRKGDGRFFAGHGDFQTTGRANHARVRDRLRVRFPDLQVPDFEAEPHHLATSTWAALAAADYVDMHGLNAVADSGDFDGYCDRINRGRKTEDVGDSNGWEHRLALYEKALPMLERISL